MQHVHGLGELGDVNHPELAGPMHSDLHHAHADAADRLPVGRQVGGLHQSQFHADVSAGSLRHRADVVQR